MGTLTAVRSTERRPIGVGETDAASPCRERSGDCPAAAEALFWLGFAFGRRSSLVLYSWSGRHAPGTIDGGVAAPSGRLETIWKATSGGYQRSSTRRRPRWPSQCRSSTPTAECLRAQLPLPTPNAPNTWLASFAVKTCKPSLLQTFAECTPLRVLERSEPVRNASHSKTVRPRGFCRS